MWSAWSNGVRAWVQIVDWGWIRVVIGILGLDQRFDEEIGLDLGFDELDRIWKGGGRFCQQRERGEVEWGDRIPLWDPCAQA